MHVSGRVTSRIYFINKNIKALIYHSLSSKYNPCISVSTSSNEVLWPCSRACAHRGSWACTHGSLPCTSGSWASFSATVFSGSKLIHSLVARGIVHGWMVPLIIDPACFTLCASFWCLDSVIASWSMACSLSFCFLRLHQSQQSDCSDCKPLCGIEYFVGGATVCSTRIALFHLLHAPMFHHLSNSP